MTNNKMYIYVKTVLKVLLCKMYSMTSFFLFLDEIILERNVVIYASWVATPRHEVSSRGYHVHYYVHFVVVKRYIGKILGPSL